MGFTRSKRRLSPIVAGGLSDDFRQARSGQGALLRIAARIEEKNLQATSEVCATGAPQEDRAGSGDSNGKIMRFAPREIGDLAQEEAVRLRREIELRFVRAGRLELPESRKRAGNAAS
jgi:hypothetical protein